MKKVEEFEKGRFEEEIRLDKSMSSNEKVFSGIILKTSIDFSYVT